MWHVIYIIYMSVLSLQASKTSGKLEMLLIFIRPSQNTSALHIGDIKQLLTKCTKPNQSKTTTTKPVV